MRQSHCSPVISGFKTSNKDTLLTDSVNRCKRSGEQNCLPLNIASITDTDASYPLKAMSLTQSSIRAFGQM